MQVGFQYYFVPNKVSAEGSRSVKGDMITVKNGKAVQVYKAKALTKEEVFAFYKPEIKRLLLLGGGYFALLVIVSLFAYGKQFFLQKAANKIIQIMRKTSSLIFKRCRSGTLTIYQQGKSFRV